MATRQSRMDARRRAILEMLRRDGQVRISELSEALGATPVTLRSDLAALEREGSLERTFGGAILTVKNYYSLDLDRRRQANMPAKHAIAAAAAALVHDGDTLFINSGTTTICTAAELKKHKNLNIVTNSIYVAMELGGTPTFRVIMLGGEINAQYGFTYGGDAQSQLLRYRASYAILSMDGVSGETGLTTYHAEESIIDKLMMERAGETIVVADSSKLGRESFSQVCGLDRVQHWVTDAGADRAAADAIARAGVDVILA